MHEAATHSVSEFSCNACRRHTNARNGRPARKATPRDSPDASPDAAISSNVLPTSGSPLSKAREPFQESSQSLPPSRQFPPITTSDDGYNTPASATTFSQIMHPSHEIQLRREPATSFKGLNPEAIVGRVCEGLAISKDLYHYLMESYFNNMTTFTLFKPYKIEEKLSRMQSATEAEALVAAIFAFAARFHSSFSTPSRPTECPPHSHFACIASKRLNEALEQLDDAVAPLWLLQAYILLTLYQLTQSVRSKSWRHLGVCIRLAYELDLHRVDFPSNQQADTDNYSIDTEHWSILEEKRRAWWAIWEMDVLASAIRRLPMAINWGYNFTFLPVSDGCWFSDSPQKSCYLAVDPNLRWKHLQESGNLSPKAWYIVINSFVYNCQLLLSDYKLNTDSTTTMADVTILANCLYCTTNSLPSDLTYHGQALDFLTRRSPQDISCRQFHNDIYCIHIMTQLVQFMIYHHQIAAEAPWMAEFDANNLKSGNENKISNHPLWSNYMKAAEDVITMVRNSSGEHYKYVNPFMINTLWIAAAAQIACRIFGPLSFNKQLAESNYELLCLNMDRSIIFWCGMDILKRRLTRVEALLKGLAARQGNDRSPIDLAGFMTSGMMASHQEAPVTDSSNVSDSITDPSMNSNMLSLIPLLDGSIEPHVSIDYMDFFAGIEQFLPYDTYDS
ncbi:hypothetical protein CFAM422_012862 [Trichoderma lentiforme]|uniref:Xylanolytic transcriptional activator regulatory domain-containing protein n=1 Tax=Trichoderma lentiforme TaxID=1567552 RepID=A0A9P4X345_9HYPO|nr:hypothetical protein CFAM422_012862 [Trichoderma lentiforme]